MRANGGAETQLTKSATIATMSDATWTRDGIAFTAAKHLPGVHDQRTHGNRYGPLSKLPATITSLPTAEFSRRFQPAQWIYRGVKSPQGAAATRRGALGGGDYGRGIYFSEQIAHAQSYSQTHMGARSGVVMRAAIHPAAKVRQPPHKVSLTSSAAMDEWAEANHVDVVDLDNYKIVRNPRAVVLDGHNFTLDESVVLASIANGWRIDSDKERRHAGLIAELRGRDGAVEPAERFLAKFPELRARHPDVELHVGGKGDKVRLSLIRTSESVRGAGKAQAALTDVLTEADRAGAIVTLTPEPLADDRKTRKARLVAWYRSHGFVMNSGRNKDYEISDAMYRLPNRVARQRNT